MFFRGSRYEGVPTATLATKDGRQIAYKRTRFIAPDQAQLGYTVQQGDRIDRVAWQVYRDPEQFWRLCDTNRAMRPDEFVAVPGRRLGVAIPAR